ncbi:hypothetical protein RAE03_06260 [Corynebacterium tuberculostearicum]|uniref:Uncharacterized protein n=1 Tax=Corynebacterium tuberculostearicum TaxID=38304 RepID=A0AAE4NKF7_9CORY|nr:hypothetical protein [Corynebacterium tuberculostearicum]MDV2419383.1 hypothetical protein [Corynebacterium tuberculostearicum]
MIRRVNTRAESEESHGWIEGMAWRLGVFLIGRPVVSLVVGCLLVALIWESAQLVAVIVSVVAVAVGVWQRERLRAYHRDVTFGARWEGPPGQVGLAAELGLVPTASRRVPDVRLIPTDAGEDLLVSCPPGLLQETVVEATPAIQQAMHAVEATAEPARGKPQVTVHLIYDDVLARDVSADWVTAIDEGAPSGADSAREPDSHAQGDVPYWERLDSDEHDDH